MANALVSLLDVSKRKGNDQAVGLLEDTVTFAPELSTLMGRVIPGTQYRTVHRTLPTLNFRKANDGSDTVKGTYRQEYKECFIIDGQMQADKAVIDAEAGGNGPQSDISGSMAGLLADEAQGVIQAAYITIGAQMYYGLTNDANGFSGIASLTASLNAAKNSNPVCVGAGGTTASVQTSAYLVWENIKGAHFIFGGNQGVTMLPEWRIQQVNGNNSKPMTAYVNNLQGWIGFAVNHPLSVGRIANINLGTDSKPLTDALVAKALSYLPLQMRQEVIANANNGGPSKWGGGLKLYMNPQCAYGLQQSRSPVSSGTGTAITAATSLNFAELPQSSNGVPIVLTDSIVNTESVLT
jgi:hypothetical protein